MLDSMIVLFIWAGPASVFPHSALQSCSVYSVNCIWVQWSASVLHSGQYSSRTVPYWTLPETLQAMHSTAVSQIIQCFTVLHSGSTLYFTVFHCNSLSIIVFTVLYFHISVDYSVAQWADSSLSAAASKFLAPICDSRHPTRCRGNYLQT